MVLDKAKTYTPSKTIPPFLVTMRVAGKTLHNCMMDSGAGVNIMPYKICQALNMSIVESPQGITQLDETPIRVVGMIHDLRIQIASEPRIIRDVDLQVVNIPPKYGMLLSRNWSSTLNGYWSMDFKHLWLPWKGVTNQIKVLCEPYLANPITEYNRTNRVALVEEDLGVYCFYPTNPFDPKENHDPLQASTSHSNFKFQYSEFSICNFIFNFHFWYLQCNI